MCLLLPTFSYRKRRPFKISVCQYCSVLFRQRRYVPLMFLTKKKETRRCTITLALLCIGQFSKTCTNCSPHLTHFLLGVKSVFGRGIPAYSILRCISGYIVLKKLLHCFYENRALFLRSGWTLHYFCLTKMPATSKS